MRVGHAPAHSLLSYVTLSHILLIITLSPLLFLPLIPLIPLILPLIHIPLLLI